MGSSLNEKGPRMRTDARRLPEEAKRNRALLLGAMESAGFVNYPHEWWHFSYDVPNPVRFDKVVR